MPLPLVSRKNAPASSVAARPAPVSNVTARAAPVVARFPFSDDALYAEFYGSVGDLIADKRDIAYVLCGNGENTFKINLPDPDKYTLTAVGNPLFESGKGVTGALAGTDYFDTGYVPGQGKLQILDAEIDVFVCDNAYDPNSGSPMEFGNDYNQIKALQTQLVTGEATQPAARITRNASQQATIIDVTTAIGLTSVARHAEGNGVRIYKNGELIGAGGGAAIGLATDENDTFKIGFNSIRRLGFCSGGSRFTDEERARWVSAVTTFLLKIGAYNPADLELPPTPGGPDPYAPPSTTVWTEAYKGTSLNMEGLTLTHDSTFDDAEALATITPSLGAGPWFSPVRSRVGFANYVEPDSAVSPFSIQEGVLRIRMEEVEGVWQTGHMQTANSTGVGGFSQTLGYFECKMKMPPMGTKGAWPAFWLYGRGLYDATSETRPEIDVIEYYPGNDSRGYHAAVHLRPGSPYVLGQVSRHWYKSDYIGMDAIRDNNWHTYGVEVTNDWIIIYMDRVEVTRIPCLPEQRVPLFMLVSLQGYNDEKAQTVSPVDLFVEYVKVWERI